MTASNKVSNPNAGNWPLPSAGFIIFLPWLTLPGCVRVDRFRFCPLQITEIESIVGRDIAPTVEKVLKCYVGKSGQPVKSCTIVLRARHPHAWNIPRNHWDLVAQATKTLALACLAEQRFFEGHFSPHLNSTMFRIIGQGVEAGSDRISPFFPRRGGGLQIGGMRYKDIQFQRPAQIEGTECHVVNQHLIKAIAKARRSNCSIIPALELSLDTFLLAHAETSELDWKTCVLLSAIAFEQILEPAIPNAQAVAAAFTDCWAAFARRTIAKAKRIKPDSKYVEAQKNWPIHRKWMKELYEARSSIVHRGPKSEFSQNWTDWQHLVIAAFTYPLIVKLRLAKEGLYGLSDREIGACEALDELLDSSWGKGWRNPPEWPTILGLAEGHRELQTTIARALESKAKDS
ncbi:HEPN domain-containing protein [Bradyrhizobium sp.]|uniref:HEPN domain-containing protein n=1 Tax=Bradyrhizobium sp. TaxID=376 RepID=UPI001ED0664C|nr:HEPN domain-containing protein [Bradyrhizobium sp.]MBV8918484.1 hypothetical protein [Bradyrhizobium sp.]MBV9986027.1 hypothetical protein [Bradyrhizobium sp.]